MTQEGTVFAKFLKENPAAFSFLKDGDLVEAKLLQKDRGAAYFSLGKYGTGMVYGAELASARGILKNLEPGAALNAKVINTENEDGYAELSLFGAQKQKNWEGVVELKEMGDAFPVVITGANSGGLLAKVNDIKAFIPVSQLAVNHYPRVADADKKKIFEELKKFVGQEMTVKILDFNPRADKLILTERGVFEESVKELISQYSVGDEVDCTVSGIADFGVFVRFTDKPEIEGLIHISEIDYLVIDHPKEIVKIDEAVRAKIVGIKDGQVLLSLKAMKQDPWTGIESKIKEGDKVVGEVYKYNPFGAYINLAHSLQGLIHVSNFESLEEMKSRLVLKEKYSFVVEAVKNEERRIILKKE